MLCKQKALILKASEVMRTVTIFIWWDSVMARQPRIDIPNTPYHVINRAVGRLQIFKTDKDY